VNRREIITLLGGTAVAWPLAVRAQQAAKLPTIGFLVAGTPSSHGQWVAAFVQRLRELGWIEGHNLAIEYRWAEGRTERAAEIAAEFVRRKVDVIVTSATAAVVAAKQATSVIPIVFAAAGDPVGTGLVASLARPGGNVFSNSSFFARARRLRGNVFFDKERMFHVQPSACSGMRCARLLPTTITARWARTCSRHPRRSSAQFLLGR
jgi:ABC-type uncharacterized transport system substrate-binding protein